MTRVRIEVDGVSYDAVVERGEDGTAVVVGDTRFTIDQVIAGAQGGQEVTLDGVLHHVRRTDLFTTVVNDVEHEIRLVDVQSGALGGAVGSSGAQVHPPMPGKVVALRVAVGETVAAHQVLVVLEAMKMQNEVTSPAAGTVRDVRVAAGDNVDTGDVLVVLGPPEDGEPSPPREGTSGPQTVKA